MSRLNDIKNKCSLNFVFLLRRESSLKKSLELQSALGTDVVSRGTGEQRHGVGKGHRHFNMTIKPSLQKGNMDCVRVCEGRVRQCDV